MGFARLLHMAASYWGFVLMALHLGLHWGMFLGMARKALSSGPPGRGRFCSPSWGPAWRPTGSLPLSGGICLPICWCAHHFVFFDFREPIPLFYLDYLAMMGDMHMDRLLCVTIPSKWAARPKMAQRHTPRGHASRDNSAKAFQRGGRQKLVPGSPYGFSGAARPRIKRQHGRQRPGVKEQ